MGYSNADRHHANAKLLVTKKRDLSQTHLVLFVVIAFALQKNVLKDVAEGKNADETVLFVNDYESMYPRFANSVENGIETILDGTSVYAREVLICFRDEI